MPCFKSILIKSITYALFLGKLWFWKGRLGEVKENRGEPRFFCLDQITDKNHQNDNRYYEFHVVKPNFGKE